MGLIHEVTVPDELEQRTLAIAEELLATPFTALRYTKRLINNACETDFDALMAEMNAGMRACLHSPEHAAVMTTYRETQVKRKREGEQ